ncbi:MAG: uncharacterized protein PWQ59_1979 [Thermoanaerobacterium sp.]|uniref:radical SAM/SPASM domain-containing protein n=1 Tax=unclassified Petrotoga TaxID=2620614 RepID=UPI000CA0535F|nr:MULTISPECIES: radical SAM protein [unclassified Petrotoga]MDI3478454.1 uncharacterized protein [Thermoanaerobacterium sp.]PNR92961.1 hypothetical protein X926_05020 [Petrotoga sp. HWHPT.55.6.3]RPD36153.1 hypothetical protein HWHPT5561_03240 [Petrotoga sp. HWH.PT.55.6.1]
MELKKSNYNVFFKINEEKFLAYNLMSKALAEFCSEDFEKINQILEKPNIKYASSYEKLKDDLLKGKFLIKERLSETKILETLYLNEKFNSRKLSLTIIPNFACNFDCPYCYQNQLKASSYYDLENAKMNQREKDAIVDYIDKATIKKEELSVTWYGGEPLLSISDIVNMSLDIKKICEKNDCKYFSFIITNGYLLNMETSKRLKNSGIKYFIVTFEGPPEIHDKRRVTKDGSPTFDTIFQNIKDSLNIFDKIFIRINLDTENINFLGDFINLLISKGLDSNKVYLIFAPTQITSACNMEGSQLDYSIFYNLLIEEIDHILKTHINIFVGDKSQTFGCSATKNNNFVISPEGNIYKCVTFAGDTAFRDGYLDTNNAEIKLNYNTIAWTSWSPFKDEKCSNCYLLPFCYGGCPYNSILKELRREDKYMRPAVNVNCKGNVLKELEFFIMQKYRNYMRKYNV